MNRFVRIYLLPGAVLQSVVVAGGYGTGREVVEYFTNQGMYAGLMGLTVAAVSMAIIFCLCLEVSRVFQVYNYRSFFQVLLGKSWFLFEIVAGTMFMLVIAVIGSAAGEVMKNELGLHPMVGVVIMLTAVTLLIFYGRELITRILAYWSILLYAIFIVYIISVFSLLSGDISQGMAISEEKSGWLIKGLQYTFYNAPAIPIILYCAMAIETRRQAIIAGITGALITTIPGLMLHISFAANYPGILDEALPIYSIFTMLDIDVLKYAYLLMLFGTFIETGAGNLQGFMERLDSWRRDTNRTPLSRGAHAGITAGLMLIAGSLSHFGIVNLIAAGYGTLAWAYFIVFVVPLFTIGIYKLIKA